MTYFSIIFNSSDCEVIIYFFLVLYNVFCRTKCIFAPGNVKFYEFFSLLNKNFLIFYVKTFFFGGSIRAQMETAPHPLLFASFKVFLIDFSSTCKYVNILEIRSDAVIMLVVSKIEDQLD